MSCGGVAPGADAGDGVRRSWTASDTNRPCRAADSSSRPRLRLRARASRLVSSSRSGCATRRCRSLPVIEPASARVASTGEGAPDQRPHATGEHDDEHGRRQQAQPGVLLEGPRCAGVAAAPAVRYVCRSWGARRSVGAGLVGRVEAEAVGRRTGRGGAGRPRLVDPPLRPTIGQRSVRGSVLGHAVSGAHAEGMRPQRRGRNRQDVMALRTT